jgi:hypothetical protein
MSTPPARSRAAIEGIAKHLKMAIAAVGLLQS